MFTGFRCLQAIKWQKEADCDNREEKQSLAYKGLQQVPKLFILLCVSFITAHLTALCFSSACMFCLSHTFPTPAYYHFDFCHMCYVFLPVFPVQRDRGGLDMCVFTWPSDNTGCFLCTAGLRAGSDFTNSLKTEAPPVSISEDVWIETWARMQHISFTPYL